MNKNWLLALISALSIFFVAMIITFSRAGNYAKERIIRHVHENALKIHGFIGIVSVHILNSQLVYQEHFEGSKKSGGSHFLVVSSLVQASQKKGKSDFPQRQKKR